MSSYHQIQEENKVIAQTIGMELLVISFQLKILAYYLSSLSKYSQALNNSSLCTNTAEANTMSLVCGTT